MPDRRGSHRLFLTLVLILFGIMHGYNITAPPNGYHQWRESDTAALALNYYQEDANFFQPRCNQRGAGSGITGSEFPIYQYTTAVGYFIAGPYHLIPRMLTLFGGMGALLFLFGIVRRLLDDRTARWATVAFAVSPLFFFYSAKIMPDVWMLAFLLGSVYAFVRYVEEDRFSLLVWSGLALVVSASIKPLGLSLYLAFFVLLLQRRSFPETLRVLTPYVVATLVLTTAWYWYAKYLTELHATQAFYMGEHLAVFYHYLAGGEFYKKLFLQWPFELWIGWVMVPAFGYGVYRAVRERTAGFFGWWIVGAYIVFAFVSAHAQSHDYYSLIIVPATAVFAGIGLERLARRQAWRRWVAIGLVLAAGVALYPRLIHRYDPMEKFDAIRTAVAEHIPRESLVMVQEETTAIRLYQLNRHGWPLRPPEGGAKVSVDQVRAAIADGAEYLVLLEPIETYRDSLRLLFSDSVVSLGPYFAYHVSDSLTPPIPKTED